MDLRLYLPLLVIVFANVIYHNLVKITPPEANAYLSMGIAYGMAMLTTFLLYFANGPKFAEDFSNLNPVSYLLGIAIVGIELGYLFLYRSGWKISSGSLIANISVALLLIIAGIIFYHEHISLKELLGIALCLGGLFIIKG
ncbi:EamA family transporter [Acetobacterium wieringae]|uniref:EamA family transporter n=1 Tax=Acetobacterium wieringae TaxID=52694 RepID=UPI002B20E202|nr:EamA family transporter [Acetobacterium wieringae]MEA4807187.1 EamA family transporter [Acetobacterium wieringae]